MQSITVDPSLGARLIEIGSQVVLCDAEGQALGFFSPIRPTAKLEHLQLESPLSIEQTEALRKQSRTGKPLEEILRKHNL